MVGFSSLGYALFGYWWWHTLHWLHLHACFVVQSWFVHKLITIMIRARETKVFMMWIWIGSNLVSLARVVPHGSVHSEFWYFWSVRYVIFSTWDWRGIWDDLGSCHLISRCIDALLQLLWVFSTPTNLPFYSCNRYSQSPQMCSFYSCYGYSQPPQICFEWISRF